jgi:hypothetical protein
MKMSPRWATLFDPDEYKDAGMMRRLPIWTMLISLLCGLPSALAAEKEAKERAAKKACLNGEPVKGVAILTDLYIDTNDSTYIFNQGRCFEQNNRYEDAVGRFREYLRKAGDRSEADKAEAKKHIDDCQALLGKNGGEPRPAVEATAPAPAVVPYSQMQPLPAATPQPGAVVEAQVATAGPGASAGSGLRAAGVAGASLGGAALVAGVVLNIKANSMVGDLEPHYNNSTDSSSKTYKTLSLVSYGAGAACVAAGAVLYYLGWKAGNQAQVALVPSVANNSAGVLLAGGF